MSPASIRRHAIYRLLDSAGDLLWVGSTQNPTARIQAHLRKPWGSQIDLSLTTIEWFETPLEASTAELAAIRRESPRHNIAGVTRPYSAPGQPRDKHRRGPDPRIMTTREVAEWLSITEATVLQHVRAGVIPASRIGAEWRFWRPLVLRHLFPEIDQS